MAEKYLASSALHLFSLEIPHDQRMLDTPTVPILRAVSNRAPLKSSFEFNCAMSRHLLGSDFADHLRIPPTSATTLIKMHATLVIQKLPHVFARYYPRTGWSIKRREVMREAMVRSVRFSLGGRNTKYRPRTAVDLQSGGELPAEFREQEGVPPDSVGANCTVRMWKEMMWEMGLICTLIAVPTTLVGWEILSKIAIKLYNVSHIPDWD